MKPLIALLDSCVFYPAPLRDFLMRLAVKGLYRAKWSQEIHEEWINSVLENRPDLTRERLDRTRALMDQHAQGSLVEGYAGHIASLNLPDPNDRHVLAAAIEGKAETIVTFNLRDFPARELSKFGI